MNTNDHPDYAAEYLAHRFIPRAIELGATRYGGRLSPLTAVLGGASLAQSSRGRVLGDESLVGSAATLGKAAATAATIVGALNLVTDVTKARALHRAEPSQVTRGLLVKTTAKLALLPPVQIASAYLLMNKIQERRTQSIRERAGLDRLNPLQSSGYVAPDTLRRERLLTDIIR